MAIDVSFVCGLDPTAVMSPPAQFEGRVRTTGTFSHRAAKIKTLWITRPICDQAGLAAASVLRTRIGGTALRAKRSIYLDITIKR